MVMVSLLSGIECCVSGGRVAAGEIAEHHRRADGAAGSAVGHAERRAHDVARCVQPGNRFAAQVENPRVGIDARAALGAQRTAVDLERVVRAPVERAEGGVAPTLAVRVAPPAVERAVAAAEVRVATIRAPACSTFDRRLEFVAVDAQVPASSPGESARTIQSGTPLP